MQIDQKDMLVRELSRQYIYTWLFFGAVLRLLVHNSSGNSPPGSLLLLSFLLTSYMAFGLAAANFIAVRVYRTPSGAGGLRRALFTATLRYALVFAVLSLVWHAVLILLWPMAQSVLPILATTELFQSAGLGLGLTSLCAFLSCIGASARVVQLRVFPNR